MQCTTFCSLTEETTEHADQCYNDRFFSKLGDFSPSLASNIPSEINPAQFWHEHFAATSTSQARHTTSSFPLHNETELPSKSPHLMCIFESDQFTPHSFNLSYSTKSMQASTDAVSELRHYKCKTVFSVTTSIILLLALVQPPIAAAINLSSEEFHPSQILSSSSPLPSNQGGTSRKLSAGLTVPGSEVKEDEVLHHLYRNGRNKQNIRKPSVTFMVELFNDLQRGGTLGYSNRVEPVTDTVRSFSGQNSRRSRKGRRTVDFHIPYLPQHETLRAAEIRFLRKPSRKPTLRRFRFRADVRAGGKIVKKLAFREISRTQYEYNVFDVTSVVRPWINNHHGNMSLNIRVSKKLRNQVLLHYNDRKIQSTSLIVLYLEDKEFLKNMYASFTRGDEEKENSQEIQSSLSESTSGSFSSSSSSSEQSRSLFRAKRAVSFPPPPAYSADNHFPEKTRKRDRMLSRLPRETRARRRRNRKTKGRRFRPGRRESCRMYDFNVDFQVIGWGEWIIHPKRFNSKFCFGQCPSPIEAKYHPTNHAMLQTLMRMKLPNVAPAPCCVPTQLKPVSMLYLEYDEVVVRSHEDMVADQCGCR
ncbi:nodal-related protein [Plakobranchus ocellatus]|uniref:Nodal-related protein n=1 Tax=Plakobranchus ocellatus TaxID=259542 RepID=A0AAV4D3U1_9GAST|nr:nodal-related protein [Plakobranchus ocellatus]